MESSISSKNDEEDKISTLSDELLHHILSYLDALQVVQTCILSKRWTNVWKSHPYLNFSSANYEKFLSITQSDDEPSRSNFNNFVNQVLARRNNFASLKVVEICFASRSSRESNQDSLVESLISYAVKHHVEEIVIDKYAIFPNCFLNCESLRSLQLNHYIDLPKSLWSLPSLTALHLDCVWEFDGKIISSCPNLEHLTIGYIRPLSEFNVHALKLKRLEILSWNARNIFACKVMIFAPELTDFYFGGNAPLVWSEVNLTSLDDVNVDFQYSSDEDLNLDLQLSLNLIKMLNEFQNARSLTLSLSAIEMSGLETAFLRYALLNGLWLSWSSDDIWFHDEMVLSKFPDAINKHLSPFTDLKYLKVKSTDNNYFPIPGFIINHFVNNSSELEVFF